MDREKYNLISSSSLATFIFKSEGPKGEIYKLIQFKPSTEGKFNLVLYDYDPISSFTSDWTISDNKDTQKILTTVASAIRAFLVMHINSGVELFGNSTSRNRLYRMAISNNLDYLIKEFVILGVNSKGFEEFRKNSDYFGFVVYLKNDLKGHHEN